MRLLRRTFFKTIAAATSFWVAASFAVVPAHAAEKVTVFAAASMKNALDAINAEWAKESGNEATVSYAASSALAKQIEQGAPADIFISADLAWMDYVAEKKLINVESRSSLLGNRIVLVAPADKAKPVDIKRTSISPDWWAMADWPWARSIPFPQANTVRPRWKNSASGPRWRRKSRARKACAQRCCSCRAAKRPTASSTRPMRPPIRA